METITQKEEAKSLFIQFRKDYFKLIEKTSMSDNKYKTLLEIWDKIIELWEFN